jgi:DnaJ-class molecular chaperone
VSIEALRQARKEIKDKGVAANEKLGQQYVDAILDVKKRMNIAKIQALREAEKPFLEELRELEEEYAVFLKMAS